MVFETRRNINETRDRRSNPREKGPVVVYHRRVVPFDLSFLFFRTLSRGFRLAGIPAAVRSGPQTASSIVGRARAPVITLREGEYGYRGPGLKPRVSPIVRRRRRVFTVHNSAECISNACQCQDRNADVVRRFAPFRWNTGPAPAWCGVRARGGQPRHYEASLRSAERFKVVIRDAKTRHPRLPGYLCTLHRLDG